MSGVPHSFRFATIVELYLSGAWSGSFPDSEGFENWSLNQDQGKFSGSVSITRSDGKVLSFDLTTGFTVSAMNNFIRWDPEGVAGADGPFV
jgi:hypothetical protein